MKFVCIPFYEQCRNSTVLFVLSFMNRRKNMFFILIYNFFLLFFHTVFLIMNVVDIKIMLLYRILLHIIKQHNSPCKSTDFVDFFKILTIKKMYIRDCLQSMKFFFITVNFLFAATAPLKINESKSKKE